MGGLFETGFGRTWTSTGTFLGNVAHTGLVCRGWHSCDGRYFTWIRLNSFVGKSVRHKWYRAGLELNLGMVYLGLLIALFMVWLGSMKMLSLPLGFSLISILDSQSVGWVTGLIIPSSQSLFNSSLTLSNFATGTQRVGAWTGVTDGYKSMRMWFPRGFLHSGLKKLG